MEELVDDFLQYLRHERGQSQTTQQLYALLLKKFVDWAKAHNLSRWEDVELSHLTQFLLDEQQRPLLTGPKDSKRRLSSSSLYLEIASLRAFYKYCETEELLPTNLAENLSLPRRWQRIPKSLTDAEIE